MNIREKIILVIMIIAILYGGFEMLRSGFSIESDETSIQSTQETPEYMRVANRINQSINEQELNNKESYVMDIIRKHWIKDPFYTRSVSNPTEPIQAEKKRQKRIENWKKHFNYNGYVEIGKNILAVINGNEYKVGDTLNNSNFELLRATPEQVILQKGETKISIGRSEFKY